MNANLPDFSLAQWDFLAVLAVFEEPIPLNVAGALTPILPGEFLEWQARCNELGWIHKVGNDTFRVAPEIPKIAVEKIEKINNPERLSFILQKLKQMELINQINPSAYVNLVARSGRIKEAVQLEINLASTASKKGDHALSAEHLNRAINKLNPLKDNPEYKSLFVSTALNFLDLCVPAGKEIKLLLQLLKDAQTAAEDLGDKRSLALMDLHLGTLYYYSDRRREALDALASGQKKVCELGDDDMLTRAAEFLGFYYFMQGLFKEAIQHLDRAVQALESDQNRKLFSYLTPLRLGYCAAYLGDFGRAVGSLDCSWRLAMGRGDFGLAALFRAALGMVLLNIKRKQDAYLHIQEALEQAIETKDALALYHSKGSLAFFHFLEGREKNARDLMAENVTEGASSGIVRQFSSPWFLEMVFCFDRLGLEPIPGFNFKELAERVLNGSNIHLHGVALRLKAKEAILGGEPNSNIMSYLQTSEDYLKRSGDPIELAKTRVEMARLHLTAGDKKEACSFAQKARLGLSGFMEELYPDDLRHLLEITPSGFKDQGPTNDILERLMSLIDGLFAVAEPDRLLTQMMMATNRFFGSERSGLFWLDGGKTDGANLRAACNMSQGDIGNRNFQPNMACIYEAFQKKQVLIKRKRVNQSTPIKPQAILCLPIVIENKVKGILYYDNSFLNDCFDCLDLPLLQKLAGRLSNFVKRICNAEGIKKKESPAIKGSVVIGRTEDSKFLTNNPSMLEILNQAKVIAASDIPVLILGETGVGKELLAQMLHRASRRSEGPFVIVDATTIPETLVESELFGFEKGAFTGADRQKIGRIEMAHKGTLFIDEIGDISKNSQGKLLRVLQEKTFTRVGGNQTHRVDFRLIVATNRDLAAEVAAGEFRHDLYHRINVLPISIPPLRERPEDIIMLAGHFVSLFDTRRDCPKFKLTSEDYKRLTSHHWPGNVRELKNLIERSVLLSNNSRFELAMPEKSNLACQYPPPNLLSMDEVQRAHILYVLKKADGKIGGPGGAAELLGMKRTTLYSRIKKLGLVEFSSPKAVPN